MTTGLVWTSDTLSPGLKKTAKMFPERLDAFLEFESTQVQDFMRTNAPWTDQTGNARGGLFAKSVSEVPFIHSIVCYHTMPYGIWLEVRWSGRYAIIDPTIQKEGRRIMTALRGLLKKMVV